MLSKPSKKCGGGKTAWKKVVSGGWMALIPVGSGFSLPPQCSVSFQEKSSGGNECLEKLVRME
jgi:hypothetical protein